MTRRRVLCLSCSQALLQSSIRTARSSAVRLLPTRTSTNGFQTAATSSQPWLDRAARIKTGDIKNALDILEERGLIKAVAGDKSQLRNTLAARRTSIYSGIDPTAPSLHLGHLIPLNTLFWLHACGHRTVSLVCAGMDLRRCWRLTLFAGRRYHGQYWRSYRSTTSQDGYGWGDEGAQLRANADTDHEAVGER